jgi:hypothetical protein
VREVERKREKKKKERDSCACAYVRVFVYLIKKETRVYASTCSRKIDGAMELCPCVHVRACTCGVCAGEI